MTGVEGEGMAVDRGVAVMGGGAAGTDQGARGDNRQPLCLSALFYRISRLSPVIQSPLITALGQRSHALSRKSSITRGLSILSPFGR